MNIRYRGAGWHCDRVALEPLDAFDYRSAWRICADNDNHRLLRITRPLRTALWHTADIARRWALMAPCVTSLTLVHLFLFFHMTPNSWPLSRLCRLSSTRLLGVTRSLRIATGILLIPQGATRRTSLLMTWVTLVSLVSIGYWVYHSSTTHWAGAYCWNHVAWPTDINLRVYEKKKQDCE